MAHDAETIGNEELTYPRPWTGRTAPPEPSVETAVEETQASALPMRIEGGFAGAIEELDRYGRDWTMMVRLLEQQRLQLESAEMERARLYAALGKALPLAVESGRSLDEAMDATRKGDISSNLSALFAATLVLQLRILLLLVVGLGGRGLVASSP